MARIPFIAALLLTASCASPAAYPSRMLGPAPNPAMPPPVGPAPTCQTAGPTAPAVEAIAASDAKSGAIAVLPIEDDDLFRSERAQLRGELALTLAKKAPDLRLTPLAEVDAALRPVTKTGQRCAFDRSSVATRAKRADLRYLDVEQVMAEVHEELWVVAHEPWDSSPIATFTAPWTGKKTLMEHYRAAFASLERKPAASGSLAGIFGRISRKNGISQSGLELCEAAGFDDCSAETRGLSGVAEAAARCFEGSLETKETLLVEGKTCELADLDEAESPRRKLESCLCGALSSSLQNGKRRKVSLHYRSPLTTGRPEPEVRIVDVKTNLAAQEEWHRPESSGAAATSGDTAVYRLAVEGLAQLSEPLSVCNPKKSEILVADVDLAATGAIEHVHFVVGSSDKALETCATKALVGRGFECTSDNLPSHAHLSVAFEAPSKKPPTPASKSPSQKTGSSPARH